MEKTEERVEMLVSGGRLVTKTAVFLGAAAGAGADLAVEVESPVEDEALPFKVLEV